VNAFELAAEYPGFLLDARAEWSASTAALFGPSGSGKTTVLEGLAGVRSVRGTAMLAGARIDGRPPEARGLGWVPQDASLFPHMTARGNIAFATGAAPDAVVDALEIRHLLDRPAGALSGGERQRVALARALAARPRFLLLDEPLSSVDGPARARIVEFLARVPREFGVPLLVVTHDASEALALAAHALVMEGGRVIASGPAREVLAAPAALGALEGLTAENSFEVRVIGRGAGVLSLETARGCRLEMAAVPGLPEPESAAVRAEDIMLAAGPPGALSAQNVLSGVVSTLETQGAQVAVGVDSCGERWLARVTPRAVEKLGLAPGVPVTLVVKAHAIRPASPRRR
jgi:molybdate transport system ATP-binding protein